MAVDGLLGGSLHLHGDGRRDPSATVRCGRAVAVAVTSITLAAACTGTNTDQTNPLCQAPPTLSPAPPASEASLPAAIAKVAEQVQQVRGLRFKRRVVPEPVTRGQIERQLRASLETDFPPDLAAREDRAWTTIGVIPAGTDLRQAVIDYGTSQIIGFYDTRAHRLVFQGGTSPTPYQRFTLAHELTHALQDQNFDLSRLDKLSAACQDERAEALLSLTEGDAVETQIRWARQDLSSDEINQLQDEASSFPPPPASTPPFVQQMFLFPYGNGQAFVEALLNRDGERAVNNAFRNPPVSTEQILHPDKYPSDMPQTVKIPDLSDRLGQGWSLLDQEDVGEGWLLMLLELRLSTGDSEDAAAGWDGGLLRAWGKGSETAVLMQTMWDTDRDASEFATAMRDWIENQVAEVHESGTTVRVLFGSDRSAVDALRAAAAQA